MSLQEITTDYQAYLEQVNDLILNRAHDRDPLIAEILNYLIIAGGKRIRPLLTIISADMVGKISNNIIKLAAAIELIHTATLLHDDVIDESLLRRNNPTVNSKWGNKTSILIGDFLFSQSFELMVETGSIKALQLLSSSSAIISEGEIMQMNNIGNINLTEEQYFKIINAKTAALFAAAMEVAAIENDYNFPNELHQIGTEFGLSFQIIDDLLDYYRCDNGGKNIGDDFLEGKVTLPIIKLLEVSNFEEQTIIKNIWNNGDYNLDNLQIIINMLNYYNINQQVSAISQNYLNNLLKKTSKFNNNAQVTFTKIINFCHNRKD